MSDSPCPADDRPLVATDAREAEEVAPISRRGGGVLRDEPSSAWRLKAWDSFAMLRVVFLGNLYFAPLATMLSIQMRL